MTVSFPRLTFVELRKMVDTRAGFWLQLATARADARRRRALLPLRRDRGPELPRRVRARDPARRSILLPIIGILLVSSEWSQRTALITFTLVPKRMRVMGAKIAASLVLGAIVLVIALVVAVVAILVVGGAWTMGLGVFGQIALLCVTAILTGVAFGAAFLSSAPAIVLYFALPLAWAALGLDPVPQRRRALAGHDAHDGADDRAAADRRGMGRSSPPRRRCGWRCPWRSACGGSPRARSAPPS